MKEYIFIPTVRVEYVSGITQNHALSFINLANRTRLYNIRVLHLIVGFGMYGFQFKRVGTRGKPTSTYQAKPRYNKQVF